MKKLGVLLGLFLFTAVAWARSYSYYETVTVFKSESVYREVTISTPHQECWEEEIPVGDEDKTAGAVIGGVAGGILGHQVGGGSGKDVATVAGAIIGTIVGSRLADDGTRYERVRKCRTIYDSHREKKLVGYNNYFEYNGKTLVKFSSRKLYEVRVRVTISY